MPGDLEFRFTVTFPDGHTQTYTVIAHSWEDALESLKIG
jgi:hypothetical protein